MHTCNCPHCGQALELRPAVIQDVDLFGVPTSTQKPSASTTRLPDRFEEWWSHYPRKIAKVACRKKWKAKKLDARAEMLIGALLEQIEHDEKWKEGFIPHPSTYINQERWDDEVQYAVEPVEVNHDLEMIRKAREAAERDNLQY